CGRELDAFAGQLGHLLVTLGTCLGVLDGRRGQCSSHEPGEPCEYEHLRAHARTRESLTYPGRRKDSVTGLGHVRADPLGDPSRPAPNHQIAIGFVNSPCSPVRLPFWAVAS